MDVSAADAEVLINSVTARGGGRYDVRADDALQRSFENVSRQSEVLTGNATRVLRTAKVEHRATTYTQAFLGVASDGFIIAATLIGLLLVVVFKPWDKPPRADEFDL